MDKIWAPWRKAYIRPDKKSQPGCLFCRLWKDRPSRDAQNYVLKRSHHNFAVLNLYPYNNGHVMIVPARHVDRVGKLTDQEQLDWLALYEEVTAALEKTLKPHGFNAGINFGRFAGAGIPKHLHFHIVPRWKGDVNFMPVIAGTKVISESLDSVYQLLKRELNKPSRPRR
jgi:ATP adenylyltransferase